MTEAPETPPPAETTLAAMKSTPTTVKPPPASPRAPGSILVPLWMIVIILAVLVGFRVNDSTNGSQIEKCLAGAKTTDGSLPYAAVSACTNAADHGVLDDSGGFVTADG